MGAMKKIAVVLSGCGFKDGSEITEAVSTLIALSESGAQYRIFAPDNEFPSKNHLTGKEDARRSALVEAARIARGKIQNINELKSKDFDGLAFPGGYGAASNLCSFSTKGAKAEIHPEIKRIISEFYKESKPILGICIAPALLALALGKEGITVTIGEDKGTASEIEKTGAQHENCLVTDYVTDRSHKVITTPAYMYDDAKPHDVFTGVRAAVRELVEMA